MHLEYEPGAAIGVEDSLSRAPLLDNREKPSVLQVSELQEEPLLKCVQEQQRQDKELNDLINYLQKKELLMDEQ